jgi:hypothetical protein
MILCRKVDDLNAGRIPIKIRFAETNGLAIGAALVIFKHFGEALLELFGHPFTHHADAIDRVHQRLGLALEYVSYDRSKHWQNVIRLAEE